MLIFSAINLNFKINNIYEKNRAEFDALFSSTSFQNSPSLILSKSASKSTEVAKKDLKSKFMSSHIHKLVN